MLSNVSVLKFIKTDIKRKHSMSTGWFLVVGLLFASSVSLSLADDLSVDVIGKRCNGTLGNWCVNFLKQKPVVWKSPPKYNKECKDDCNGVGQCNYMTGECLCPAGTTGLSCSEPELRPCTDRFRESWNDPVTSSYGLKGIQAVPSRCAGICDEDTGHCYCSGKHGRVNAVDAPPGSPPLRRGRYIPRRIWHWHSCGPDVDEDGKKSFGFIPYDDFFGPAGVCNADKPTKALIDMCSAVCLDDLAGPNCDRPKLATCISQCNGHGDCNLGFCKCHEGYFGHDCAQLKAGATPSDKILNPMEELYANATNANDPPPKKTRKSPLIFIYDLPTIYNSRLLQYRTEPLRLDHVGAGECCHRMFDDNNNSRECSFIFAMETALHELIAQSDHRTFDPNEADYFYLPVYASCYMMDIWGFADFPWFYGIGGQKPAHVANMMLQAKRYVEHTHPYWNASGGADHIFFFTFDEASCYVPAELRNSTILTHWGETRREKKSQTSTPWDNYSTEWIVPELSNLTWQYVLDQSLPCFDSVKDLVIPALRPINYYASPMFGRTGIKKTRLLSFRGDLRLNSPAYSQGIRQELYRLHEAGVWRQKYNIFIGAGNDPPGDYSEILASSVFCAVLPGEGYSSRATDAITNGCIPVVIQDGVQAEFETVIDWGEFGVRINQSDIAHIPEILLAFSEEQIETMQKNLAKIWHRFIYTSLPLVSKLAKERVDFYNSSHNATTTTNFDQDDAFDTIMGFLHHRIPFTRSVKSRKPEPNDTRLTTLQYLEFDDDAEDNTEIHPFRLSHLETTTYEYHLKNDSRVIGRRKRLRQRKRRSHLTENKDD